MWRNLVKQGRGALTLTLPAAWVREKGLSQEDQVWIEQTDNELRVSVNQAEKKEITINVKGKPESLIWHILQGVYVDGYDTIIISHNDPEHLAEVASTLIGMAIERHTATQTIITSLIAKPERTLESLMRRASHMFVEQARNLQGIHDKSISLDQYRKYEHVLDETLLYCMRYINKYEGGTESYRYFSYCLYLELAADELRRIAKFIHEKPAYIKQIIRVVEQFDQLFAQKKVDELYLVLRKFHRSIKQEKFIDGLVYSFAEILYNNIGYFVGSH